MNIYLPIKLGSTYTSRSQKARVITETWLENNVKCPFTGENLVKSPNNKEVEDFRNVSGTYVFELKSIVRKSSSVCKTIMASSYDAMLRRISQPESERSNFLLLYHDGERVLNLILIPYVFITKDTIVKRKPLAPTAKRAGWVGCNIDATKIPDAGKIYLIKDGVECPSDEVTAKLYAATRLNSFLRRDSWLLDIMNIVARQGNQFKLDDIYKYERALKVKHPRNLHIQDKIRQQLQILVKNGLLCRVSRGVYEKCM